MYSKTYTLIEEFPPAGSSQGTESVSGDGNSIKIALKYFESRY